MYYVAHIHTFVLYKLKQLFNLQLFIICLLLIKHSFSWPLNKSYKKMLNQSKIKYILASSVLFLLLFVIQYTPKKSMLFNKLENQINIINTFPDINPEKCLRSSKFFGGNSNKEPSFSCAKKQLKNFQCVVSCHVCTHQSWNFPFIVSVLVHSSHL